MDPVIALIRLGGVADHKTLLRVTTRRRLRRAVAVGEVNQLARGQYALPTADVGRRAAGRLTGVASHLSAAAIHGWKLAHPPEHPTVTVPRNRNVPPHRRVGATVYWRDLPPEDRHGLVTSPHRTVIDCAKDLPFADALAVADSALRDGAVDPETLERLALALPTNGRTAALRVVTSASPLAANPFESVLRAIALDVPELSMRPQVTIDERGFLGRPDLVDVQRRIIAEAESFEFHGKRKALHRDCERYNALVLRGWTVLRFSWEHVMLEPEYVRDALVCAVEGPHGRATLPPTLLWTA